jgi:hypothetical protein
MEQINLTSPVVADPAQATTFRVAALWLNWDGAEIVVHVTDGTVRKVFRYTGSTATALMTALNKANLTSNSLHKRIINQLISDGYLSGTISGSPD